jgi:hypothetical protein
VGVGLVTDILFNPLHPLIVLIDYPHVLRLPVLGPVLRKIEGAFASVGRFLASRRAGNEPTGPPRSARSALASSVLGSIFVVAMVVAGILGIDSWPVSVYPRFAQRVSRDRVTARAFAFMIVGNGGSEREVKPSFYPIEDSSGVMRFLKQTRRQSARRENPHVALVARIVRENCGPFAPGERLRIYDFTYRVDPDERDGKKHELRLLAETGF